MSEHSTLCPAAWTLLMKGPGTEPGHPLLYTARLERPFRRIVGASPCLSGVGLFGNIHGKWPRPRRGGGGEGKGGDPCGRPRPSIERDEGDHKGPHSTTQPLPPLRG